MTCEEGRVAATAPTVETPHHTRDLGRRAAGAPERTTDVQMCWQQPQRPDVNFPFLSGAGAATAATSASVLWTGWAFTVSCVSTGDESRSAVARASQARWRNFFCVVAPAHYDAASDVSRPCVRRWRLTLVCLVGLIF